MLRRARTATSSADARPSRAATRAQMIDADAAALRALAGPIAEAVAMDAVCVFGSRHHRGVDAGLAVIDLLNE